MAAARVWTGTIRRMFRPFVFVRRSFKLKAQQGFRLLRRRFGLPFFRDYVEDVTEAWWGGGNESLCKNGLSVCIDTVFRRDDDEGKLYCCPNWRRRLTNKLTGREFAIKYGIPVPHLYWEGKLVDDIPFHLLPSSFVVKTSFGAGGKQVLVVRDWQNFFTGGPLGEGQIKEFFRGFMAKPAPFGYLLVEEFASASADGALPDDYKCHVFGGKVMFIQVNDKVRNELTWYTREWKQPLFDLGSGKLSRGRRCRRPVDLDTLIEYAERLGRAYGPFYVRIDFFGTTEGWVFGEFTATPSKGKGRTLYGNYVLGKLWSEMLKTRKTAVESDSKVT